MVPCVILCTKRIGNRMLCNGVSSNHKRNVSCYFDTGLAQLVKPCVTIRTFGNFNHAHKFCWAITIHCTPFVPAINSKSFAKFYVYV